MELVKVTGWTVHYTTYEISLATLLALMQSGNGDEPTGILANPNLDMDKLKGFGLRHKK